MRQKFISGVEGGRKMLFWKFPAVPLGWYDGMASVGKNGVNKFHHSYKMCVALVLHIQESGVQT